MRDVILNELKHDYYQINYPNDGQRFIAWYLRNIHNLDESEAKFCITDGSNDKQIDAVYVDNQNCKIYIIQGKYYNSEVVNAEPLREIFSSWLQIKNLDHLQENANEQLKVKINEISQAIEEDYELCFELITTSKLSEQAVNDLELFKKELSDCESLSANIVIVDNEVLKFKYEDALNKNRPYINYDFKIEDGKYMELKIGDFKTVIAAVPLKDCINIPGITDGSLFRKNVRQSLGFNNKVNRSIAKTIKYNSSDFFLMHNGITAISSKISISNGILSVRDLNVVNGCQSLTTIYSCSESAKHAKDAYIMFRFYEINDPERADNISISTNNQSSVKARDLRSNDKSVLAMKKAYEQRYPNSYFITKRGEEAKTDSPKYNKTYIVNLSDLGKWLIAWHSQRPNLSYGETKIFDKYFDQLFRRNYSSENIQALNILFNTLYAKWNKDNPLNFDETLLAMKAYAPYHQLYTISYIVSYLNKMNDLVPSPDVVLQKLNSAGILDNIIDISAACLNMALTNIVQEYQDRQRIFVPPNWIKSKESLKNLKTATNNYLSTLRLVPGGKEIIDNLTNVIKMDKEDFSSRWAAD